ncbi:sugar ABC transporter ATP-binding protein [Tropicimonas isoalkanivorans]|uniref:Ribose/galactose/methyl galactoside import ATP-binding protein n=1 Tax=Tropicimonas isoalkanivorans TaxID=441112 RepID=A0A1I1HBY7_9RHOB|nr:sugar ABC transporter ATP-binding protein [Tropicimonas isoalkanivorans]SFC21112.1 inositol transport system ATP-binding protein [Tropicimonas isoalkanivorans]
MLDGGGGTARKTYTGEYILEVDDVRKEFPGVVALDNVQLRIRPGTVHALMGENGAGKSTLMKIIAGIYKPDRGEVRFAGEPIDIKTPIDALNSGIAMIHQELNLMNTMTVAENVWIRREPKGRGGLIDHATMRRMTQTLFDDLNIPLDPRATVGDLTVAQKQMIEIAKAVSYSSDVLIMDEPTSALTESEVDHLFTIIRDLKSKGVGIVYITHKMDELFEIADELTVFRDGQYVGTEPASNVTRDDVIRMMVGREITDMFPKIACEIGEPVLEVRNLGRGNEFRNVTFELRAGEILGLAGLVGAGRSEVAEALFGVKPATTGNIVIDGKPVTIGSPTDAMEHGMAFLTEDRKESGCFLILDCLENIQMALVTRDMVTKTGFVQQAKITELVNDYVEKLRIKTPSLGEIVENLSGGNQQKLLIARWLLTNPKILILDEPTRGIDVGAKSEIHRLITQLAGQGVAILMISSELPEVLGMSDRIMVMHEGNVSGFLDRSEADQVSVMKLAAK